LRRGAVSLRDRFPLLAAALERHLTWTSDFAAAGDLESAIDAIQDAQATLAELRAGDG
jgi:hypothetical protein